MMKELSKQELDGLLTFNKKRVALYFYTPLCGTCKLATRMLEVTLEALPTITVYTCNVNMMAEYVAKWQISSVPCLIMLEKNQVVSVEYSLQSVAKLYTTFSAFFNNKGN